MDGSSRGERKRMSVDFFPSWGEKRPKKARFVLNRHILCLTISQFGKFETVEKRERREERKRERERERERLLP